MNRKINEDEFNEYIKKLQELFKQNPEKATKEAHDSLERLTTNSKEKFLDEKEKSIFYQVLFFIIIALIGLLNIKTYLFYLFGLIFFATGSLIGLYLKGFGLIFFFSHGMTGLGFMMAGMLGELITNPFMSDAPIYVYCILGLIVFLIVLAIISSILFNLSDRLKKRKNFIFVPLLLFGAAILIAVMLSCYVSYKYGITPSVIFT